MLHKTTSYRSSAALAMALVLVLFTPSASALFCCDNPFRSVVQQVSRAIDSGARQAVRSVQDAGKRVQGTLRRAAATVRSAAGQVVAQGQTIIKKAVDTVKSGVKAVQQGVGNLVKAVGLPAIKTGLNKVIDLVEGGSAKLGELVVAPLQLVKGLLGPLGGAFDVTAIAGALKQAGKSGAADAKKCVGAFNDLSLGQVGTLAKCLAQSVIANLPGLGQFIAFMKDAGLPGGFTSPEGLLKAFTKLGGAGMKAVEAVYKMGLDKLPGVPQLEVIQGLWGTAQKIAGELGSGKLGDNLQKIVEKVMTELTEVIPKFIEKFTGFRDGVRKLLTLELKSPFEQNAAVQAEIDRVAANVLDPIVIIIGGLIKKLVPAKVVDDTIKLVRQPMMTTWSAMMRGLIFGRSVLKQAARLILPRIIEGGANVAGLIEKFLPKVPPVVKEVLLAVFDQMQSFFGGIGSFMLTLVPELKETVERVLDSIVGATQDVKGVMATLSGASKAKSPLAMLDVMAGIGDGSEGGGEGEAGAKKAKAAPATKLDPVAIAAARKAYAAAGKREQELILASETADNKYLEAKFKSEAAGAAEKGKAQAAHDAAEKAGETTRAAQTALLKVDPDAATERVITTVWGKLSEAFMKVVWDGGTAVADLFITSLTRLYLFAMQVVIAAAGGVGGVFVVTMDWVPLLAELYGTVCVTGTQILAEAGRTIFNSVVLPELRGLIKDQLVDYGTLFVELWKNPAKRKQMQVIGNVVEKLFKEMGPFADRLAKVRDTVKAGASALYAGPLGGFFKQLPPQLFAAISKAVTKGAELLQQLAIQLAKKVATAVASKGKGGGEKPITPTEIAKLIIHEVRDPVIDYLTSLLPEEDEYRGLKTALTAGLNTAADALEREPSPAKLLNPGAMIKLIGDALNNARLGLGEFLAGKAKLPELDGFIAAGIGRIAKLLQSGQLKKEIIDLLKAGPIGLIREVFALKEEGKKSLEDFIIDDLLLKNAPADLREELRTSLHGAFKLVLEPGALAGVLKAGVRGVVAKVVELAHAPVTKLLLRDFPEGPVTQALRETLFALGQEASQATSPLFDKLIKGGLAGIAGMLLAKEKVAGALALVLTADLSDAEALRASLQTAIKSSGNKLAESGLSAQFSKAGIKSLLVDFGKPVAEYLIAQLAKGVPNPGLASAVRTLLLASLDDLVTSKSLADALRNVPQRMLSRVLAYAKKLVERAEALGKAKAASLRAALGSLASALQSSLSTTNMLKEANAALISVAGNLGQATLPSVEEVLR